MFVTLTARGVSRGTKRSAPPKNMTNDAGKETEHDGDGTGAPRHEVEAEARRNEARPQVMRVFAPDGASRPGNQAVSNMPIDAGRLFEQALEQTRMAVALSDPYAPDNPLVFVNRAFEMMTGYDRREAVGRNCRFLQTERTSRVELDRLRKAMAAEETTVVELENRRKDGSIFVNALHVGPIYDESGRLTHFYGSQWNVSELVEQRAEIVQRAAVAQEMQHRMGNLFGVVSSIVRLSGRGETDVRTALDKANERILALARAHQMTSTNSGAGGDPTLLHDLVETVLEPYRLNAEGRIVLGGKRVELPPRAITPIGLALHELATNAVKYGALKQPEGRVLIEWMRDGEGGGLRLVWEEEGGAPVLEPREGAGTGTRILKGVMGAIEATITFDWRERGVKVTIAMPLDETPERT